MTSWLSKLSNPFHFDQFPDAFHATINGKSVTSLINNDAWIQNEFIPIVQVSIEQLYFKIKTDSNN